MESSKEPVSLDMNTNQKLVLTAVLLLFIVMFVYVGSDINFKKKFKKLLK